ncbi:MAG: TetR/AcrR family transcriptional regulator [Ilumatobacteraceae bacterium]
MTTGTGIRARLRAELVTEIKRLAREQISRDGAPNLSLRAIARDLGMVSSAIYRYFPSRDQLLTELIIDSYDDVGRAVEVADAAVPRDDLVGRWRAVAFGIRRWAIEHPADYGLIFGTPVPGYVAPTDTIGPASRYTNVLIRLLVDIERSGAGPSPGPQPDDALASELEYLRRRLEFDVSDELLLAGIAGWMNLIGAITLELFGHLHNVIDDKEVHYRALVDRIGRRIIRSYR